MEGMTRLKVFLLAVLTTLATPAAWGGWVVSQKTEGMTLWKDAQNPSLIVVRAVTPAPQLAKNSWNDQRLQEYLSLRGQVLADLQLRPEIFSAKTKVVSQRQGAEIRGQYRHRVKASFVSFHEVIVKEKAQLISYLMSFESKIGFQPEPLLREEKAFRDLLADDLKTAALESKPDYQSAQLFWSLMFETAHAVPGAGAKLASAGTAAGSCMPQGVIGSALGKLCEKLKATQMCQKFAAANPSQAIDCSSDPKGEASTWDMMKACGAGAVGEIGKVYDFAKMLVNAVVNGQETAGKLSAEVKEFAQTAGAYVMSEYDRNLAAASDPFKSGKAILGVAGNLFQGMLVVMGELLETEVANLSCRNSKARLEAICAKVPYFLAGAGAAIMVKRLAAYYGKLNRGKALAKTEAELKALSRTEREAMMNHLGPMTPDERKAYVAKMLQRGSLTKEQGDALIRAHDIAADKSYFKYTPAELKAKRKELMDGGFSEQEANIALRSGGAGNSGISMNANFSPDGKVDMKVASGPNGILRTGTHLEKQQLANEALKRGDYESYRRVKEVLAEDPASPSRARDLIASGERPGSGRLEAAIEKDVATWKKNNFDRTEAVNPKGVADSGVTQAYIADRELVLQKNQARISSGDFKYPDDNIYGSLQGKVQAVREIETRTSVVEDLKLRLALMTRYQDEFGAAVPKYNSDFDFYEKTEKALKVAESELRTKLTDFQQRYRGP